MMATVEKFSIALTPELANDVRMAVKNGEYASSSEVIRDALRDWRRKRAFQVQELNELRSLWQAGMESGHGQYGSMEDIKQAARKCLDEDNK